MKYTCPYCDHKMPAIEANNAFDGCPCCRKQIDWTDWMDSEEISELETEAENEQSSTT